MIAIGVFPFFLQRAFRQRKEGYIKKLEEQVKNMHAVEEALKSLQAENYQLRDYIISLQSRLIEAQGDFPQPPSNIDLGQPRHDALPPPMVGAPAAAAAAGAGAGAVPTAQMGGAAGAGGSGAAAAPSPPQGGDAHAHPHASHHNHHHPHHPHHPLQVSAAQAQVVAAATTTSAAAAVDAKPLHGQQHDEAAAHNNGIPRLRVDLQRLKADMELPRVDPAIAALRAG